MKVSVRSYISFFVSASILYAFYLKFSFGLFTLSFLLVYFLFNISIRNRFLNLSYFIVFLSFLFAYVIRAFILVPHPDRFMYPWIKNFSHTPGNIVELLFKLLLYFILIGFGFVAAIRINFFHRRRQPRSDSSQNRTKRVFTEGWPFKYYWAIVNLMSILVLVKLSLFFFTGAGLKGVESNTGMAFLLRLIPDDLIFIVAVVYLVRYKKFLLAKQIRILYLLVFFMSLSILLTGSKIFLILFGLCLLIVYLYEGYKLSWSAAAFFTLLAVATISLSFVISFTIKNRDPQNLGELIYYATDRVSATQYLDLADQVSQRFIGLDGYLVANEMTKHPESLNTVRLTEEFSIKNIVLRIGNNLVPFVDFTNSMGPGKAIIVYIFGFPEDITNAGAIGLFGAFKFIWSNFVWLLSLIYGWIIGTVYVMVSRIKDSDVRLIIFYFVSYFFIHSFMSGIFDLLIALLIIKVVLLFVYLKGIVFIRRMGVSR